ALDQPVLPVADRERCPPPSHQLHAPTAGEVLPRPPWISGRRSRGFSQRTHLGRGHAGGPARPVADQWGRPVPSERRSQPGLARGRAPPRFTPMPGSAGSHSRDARPRRAAASSPQVRRIQGYTHPSCPPGEEPGFMTWSDFYLICFLVGLSLSLI